MTSGIVPGHKLVTIYRIGVPVYLYIRNVYLELTVHMRCRDMQLTSSVRHQVHLGHLLRAQQQTATRYVKGWHWWHVNNTVLFVHIFPFPHCFTQHDITHEPFHNRRQVCDICDNVDQSPTTTTTTYAASHAADVTQASLGGELEGVEGMGIPPILPQVCFLSIIYVLILFYLQTTWSPGSPPSLKTWDGVGAVSF